MSNPQNIEDLLLELEEAQAQGEAPPQPEHGAGGAHQAFTGPPIANPGDDIPLDLAQRMAEIQRAQSNLSTQIMLSDQAQLLMTRKKMEQDNLLKELILKKNQNQVLNLNPYITQEQDIAVAQRRFAEAQKAKQDYFTRAEQLGIMAHEQQYLQQQLYSNSKWGIPVVQGLVYGDQEFFTR